MSDGMEPQPPKGQPDTGMSGMVDIDKIKARRRKMCVGEPLTFDDIMGLDTLLGVVDRLTRPCRAGQDTGGAMNKLRPVEDVWDELSEPEATDEDVLGIIQAERVMIGEACAEAYKRLSPAHREEVVEAIIAVAQPPEPEREQLGRKCWNARRCERDYKWEDLPELEKEAWREIAAAVLAEQRKIEEEQKL